MLQTFLQSNGYIFAQDEGLWIHPGYQGITYNDGDEIETRLKTIIAGASDLSVMSIELAGHCTDWPSLYHLSRKRANLLRPFEERLKGKHVLEVGAGCGALTRYLGEVGAEVVAVEGSQRRASIVASRCRDLRNVTVMSEAAHRLNPEPSFDVVTLIGVLEYARKFFPGEASDPVDALMVHMKKFLKPSGLMIIAIENQLGLKYFAGFPEDHVGLPMFGIEDHYRQHDVVTFGRRELAQRIQKAGLPEQEWWYPFPDYKLPNFLVSELGIEPPEGIDLTPVLRNACLNDPQFPARISFNQERALRPIVRNGLLKEVANSFIVLAAESPGSEQPEIPLAVHFATERRPKYAKKVVFTAEEHCAGETSQMALYPTTQTTEPSLVTQRLVNQEFVKGELWQDRLMQIMTNPGWTITEIAQWATVWMDAFRDVVGITKSFVMTEKVPGRYLDMIPRNMILAENDVPVFIDQEWVFGESLEVGYLVFRGLFSSFLGIGRVAETGENFLPSILCLIKEVGQRLGYIFSEHEVKRYHSLECDFQQIVAGNPGLPYDMMVSSRFRVCNTLSVYARHPAEVPEQGDGISSIVAKKGGMESCSSPASSSPYAPTRYEGSIIIPVYNRGELTEQCLLHVAEVTQDCHYEVIVVDNASTDHTKAFLSTLRGDIQVISNPENFGFATACNQGAAAAKGQFLVFLNNDTIPKAGWLRALVHEVQQHPDVAVVGSKLLYPNDTIQHAGVVFSKESLGPYHIFNGAPGDLPAVNVRRELQVVTAACFLVRREDFEAIGGFDEGFRNGFEDVDLCLKIRERGQKVIYQPKSVLYHLESQTPGRKNSEVERHNWERLMKRWASKIVVDEDLYAVPEGYATHYYYREGWLRQSLKPIQSDLERKQWAQVQRVQELLLCRRYDLARTRQYENDRELHALLSNCGGWPEDGEVFKWAAQLCQNLQLFDAKLAFLKQTLNLEEYRTTREQAAKLALNMQDLSGATHHIQALLQSHPNHGSGHWLQGILSMQSQHCAEAARSFRRAIQYGYDTRKTGIGLGMACMGMGDVEEAWKVFEQVIEQFPDDVEAMQWLIQAGTFLHQWEKLSQQLTRYLERNPGDCDMRFAHAGVEIRAGRLEAARREFETLSLLKPDYEGLTALESQVQIAAADLPG